MGYNNSVHLLNTRIFVPSNSNSHLILLHFSAMLHLFHYPSTRATGLPSPHIATSLTRPLPPTLVRPPLYAIGHATDELRRNGEDGEDNGERYGFL